ncbi:protein transport protein sec22 [Cordyceps fumosorosea ARSEF 2679]|uniref:Protein transport protein SEC22 n=1 Tax=Cordyceps fumosorosea (strain ARSEF 2679) TaxID=1081104 RepID=A0A168DCG1_CORFA|nr:protein transport protein sec22 [Cordyceps fumosorosea ARSEF 2679]OAA72435.1 protein transport protein sec22 [Cordyceps fumosorosea ARSEF 2679]
MQFSVKALATLALSLHVGLAACATAAEEFLAQHPDIQVGRAALTAAEATHGPDTFGIVNKPVANVVLYQEFNADTHDRISAVALVDDAEAEAYYNKYNKDGDAVGKVMKRFEARADDASASKCKREEPRDLFARAARCGQFCSRSFSCTVDARCPSCKYPSCSAPPPATRIKFVSPASTPDTRPQAQPANEALRAAKKRAMTIIENIERNSQPRVSADLGDHTINYLVEADIVFLCICVDPYPTDLAFIYLADLAREFLNQDRLERVHSQSMNRSYAFGDFETTIAKTCMTYNHPRAVQNFAQKGGAPKPPQNLDKLNAEVSEVRGIMFKNVEDLLHRGESLESMSEISSRLRDDSKKYRRAAVRINWELLLKQYAPFAVLGFIFLVFFYYRFF